MPVLVVELHVPLAPAQPVEETPWIEAVEEELAEREGDDFEVYDDAEQVADEFVFFLTGRHERDVLRVAGELAARPGVPAGAYAVVTNDLAEEVGAGRRVALPR